MGIAIHEHLEDLSLEYALDYVSLCSSDPPLHSITSFTEHVELVPKYLNISDICSDSYIILEHNVPVSFLSVKKSLLKPKPGHATVVK